MTGPTSSDASDAPMRWPWPPLLMVLAIAAGWAMGRVLPVAWPGLDDLAARVIGLSIGALGLALFAWTTLTLWRHGTTVLPDKPATALVTDGPFRWRRNPIYLSYVMVLLGIAELSKNVWFVAAAALFAVLVTALAIGPEERHLEARFGDAYRDYKAKTRRWI